MKFIPLLDSGVISEDQNTKSEIFKSINNFLKSHLENVDMEGRSLKCYSLPHKIMSTLTSIK